MWLMPSAPTTAMATPRAMWTSTSATIPVNAATSAKYTIMSPMPIRITRSLLQRRGNSSRASAAGISAAAQTLNIIPTAPAEPCSTCVTYSGKATAPENIATWNRAKPAIDSVTVREVSGRAVAASGGDACGGRVSRPSTTTTTRQNPQAVTMSSQE